MVNNGLCKETDLADQKNDADALFKEDWHEAVRMLGGGCPPIPAKCTKSKAQELIALCDQLEKDERTYWTSLFRRKCKVSWPAWHGSFNHHPDRFAVIQSGKRLKKSQQITDQTIKQEMDIALENGELPAIGYDVSFVRKIPGVKPESHLERRGRPIFGRKWRMFIGYS